MDGRGRTGPDVDRRGGRGRTGRDVGGRDGRGRTGGDVDGQDGKGRAISIKVLCWRDLHPAWRGWVEGGVRHVGYPSIAL